VALVPLLLVLLPAAGPLPAGRAFRLGYWHGLAFFLLLLHWIPRLPPENVTVPFLMYPALGLAAAYLSLYPAVWAAGTVVLCRRGRWPLALAAPPLWALVEALRGFGVIGFPWGSLGYSQWGSLPLIQFASISGLWSVSLWVVLVNVALFGVIRATGRRRLLAAVGVLLLFAGPWLHGRGALARAARPGPGQPVVLIQPNTGNDKWDPARRVEVISGLSQRTMDAAGAAPRDALVIWPETATPTLLLLDPPNFALVRNVVDIANRPLLTGYPDRKLFRRGEGTDKDIEARYYNNAGLLLPAEGMVETCSKTRLVPFSEWMPIPGLNRVNFGQSNFTPGDSLHVFGRLENRFGVLICFESIFPDLSRRLVRGGARFLVNITNDQWFGRSAAPYQHLTMAVFRAIENDVGIARAANTGVTCLIEPSGAIRQATRLFEPATVAGAVRLAGRPTFYTRHGDWILVLCGLAVMGGIVAAWRRWGEGR
jgi:apolipoprotein N-acyltransferase